MASDGSVHTTFCPHHTYGLTWRWYLSVTEMSIISLIKDRNHFKSSLWLTGVIWVTSDSLNQFYIKFTVIETISPMINRDHGWSPEKVNDKGLLLYFVYLRGRTEGRTNGSVNNGSDARMLSSHFIIEHILNCCASKPMLAARQSLRWNTITFDYCHALQSRSLVNSLCRYLFSDN